MVLSWLERWLSTCRSPVPPVLGHWMAIAREAADPWAADFHELRGLGGSEGEESEGAGEEDGADGLVLADAAGQLYLPIERFRDDGGGGVVDWLRERPRAAPAEADWGSLESGTAVERLYRSSGTTGEERAVSPFTRGGLDAYRISSVYHFLYAAAAAMGSTPTEVLEDVRLVSLVPPPSLWPDSSLAQMVAWCGDLLKLTYAGGEGQASLAQAIAGAEGRPVWLFGTAFHLVNAIDERWAARLPDGSLVIETGGTKGKSRSIERGALYEELAAAFAVRPTAIVSEYGMSELAAQAYDVAYGETALAKRMFRWPGWVKVDAVTGPGGVTARGVGGLRIFDPLRIDVPWAIRTEDLADVGVGDPVGASGAMRLLGRLPAAPLKGCSLNAEKVVAAADPGRQGPTVTSAELLVWAQPAVETRARQMASAWQAWTGSAALLEALEREIGSDAAARAAVEDLRRSAPGDAAAWVSAASTALGRHRDGGTPRRWLIIAPESHSLAALHPIAIGYVAGLALAVRLPDRFAGDVGAVASLVEALRSIGAEIETVGSEYRVGAGPTMPYGGIVAFGSDETVDSITRAAGAARVSGFGNRMGMSLIRADNHDDAARAVRDALSLGQRGCMATRLVVAAIGEETAPEAYAEVKRRTLAWLDQAAQDFWRAPLPIATSAALDAERARLARRGMVVPATTATTTLIVARDATVGEIATGRALTADAALRAFTIPVLFVKGATPHTLVKMAEGVAHATAALGTITMPASWLALRKSSVASRPFPSYRLLGEANAPVWDGSHEGRPLFMSAAATASAHD